MEKYVIHVYGLHILTNFYTYCDIKANIMQNKTKFRPNPEARLMDQVKEVLRYHSLCLSHREDVLSMDLANYSISWRKDSSKRNEATTSGSLSIKPG